MHSLKVKNKSPPLYKKNGYPSHEKSSYSILYPLLLGRRVALFFTQFRPFVHFWLLGSCAIYHSKFSFKYVKNWFYFSDIFLKKCPPPSTPLNPGYGSQKHHLPWKHFWPMHTWIFFSPPLWKKWCPCVLTSMFCMHHWATKYFLSCRKVNKFPRRFHL